MLRSSRSPLSYSVVIGSLVEKISYTFVFVHWISLSQSSTFCCPKRSSIHSVCIYTSQELSDNIRVLTPSSIRPLYHTRIHTHTIPCMYTLRQHTHHHRKPLYSSALSVSYPYLHSAPLPTLFYPFLFFLPRNTSYIREPSFSVSSWQNLNFEAFSNYNKTTRKKEKTKIVLKEPNHTKPHQTNPKTTTTYNAQYVSKKVSCTASVSSAPLLFSCLQGNPICSQSSASAASGM